MAIEIVDFPIKNGDFPWFVCLPEGSTEGSRRTGEVGRAALVREQISRHVHGRAQ